MKICRILMINQPDIHKKLSENKERNKKKRRRGIDNLSFSDILNLMKHDSYKRVKGRMRQK